MSTPKSFDIVGTTTLSVTSTSGNVALTGANGADLMLVQNTGTKSAYLKLGTSSSITAATTDFLLQAGASCTLEQHTFTYLAAICGGSDTTTLYITSGSGNPEMALSAEVNLGSLTVTSDATATAAAPSYSEGTANPLSQNLTGDLRVIAKIAAGQTLATVTTVAAVTAITNALPAGTNVIGGVTIPTGTYTDKTITSMSGSSQTLIASNAARKSIVIQNTGNANVGVSLSGGTAVIAGAATVTLAPGASYVTGGDYIPTNAITVIGTSGQPVAAFEG